MPTDCPDCGTSSPPVADAVTVGSPYGPLTFEQERFECGACAWSWATDAQRDRNRQRYGAVRQAAKYGL